MKTITEIHGKTCQAALLVYVHSDYRQNVLKCLVGHEFVVHPDICSDWLDWRYSGDWT